VALIELLLNKNQDERLGSKNDALDLMNHSFYKSIDWVKAANRELVPPFVPLLKSECDTKMFDNNLIN
jgi:hypothetical protein